MTNRLTQLALLIALLLSSCALTFAQQGGGGGGQGGGGGGGGSCPTATSSTLGCVKPDNTTITISSGVLTATGSGGDTITSPNSTLNVGGTTTATTLDLAGSAGELMAGATPALTYTPQLGVDNSHAGTLALSNGSASAHTVFGSAATTTNTILGPATVLTNLHTFYCAVATTTCTLTDTGYAYNAIPYADLSITAANIGTLFNIASGDLMYSGGTTSAPSGSADFTISSHTLSGGASAILDLSAATGTAAFKVPVAAGNTASANGAIDFDSTNKQVHDFTNGVDSLEMTIPASVTITNGHCVEFDKSGSTVWLEDTGSACGSGGGGDTITTPNSTLVVGGTSSATTLDLAGSAGELMAGSTPALTATPTLGVNGTTTGTLTLDSSTSGNSLTLNSSTPTITAAGSSGLTITASSAGITLTPASGNSVALGIAGTAANPALVGNSSATTGFYSTGTSFIFSSGGTAEVGLTSSGVDVGSHCLGGSTNATASLDTSLCRGGVGVWMVGTSNTTNDSTGMIHAGGNLLQQTGGNQTAVTTTTCCSSWGSISIPSITAAKNWSFHCAIPYTLVGTTTTATFGIEGATNAVTFIGFTTSWNGAAGTYTSASAPSTTTWTSVAGPSAQTAGTYVLYVDGTVEMPTTKALALTFGTSQSGGTSVAIQEGAYCNVL